jgi:minichromosome maintenance protein 10
MNKQGEINLKDLKKSFAGFTRSSSSAAPRNGLMVLGGGGASVKRKPGLPPPSVPSVVYGSTVHVTTGTRNSDMKVRVSSLLSNPSRNGGHFIPGVREGPSVSEEKKRLLRQADADKRARKELKELVGKDRGKTNGGEMVQLAGLALGKAKAKAAEEKGKSGKGKGKKRDASSEAEDDGSEEEERKAKRRSVLSGAAARIIGFDPTAKAGEMDRDESKEGKEFRVRFSSSLSLPSSSLPLPLRRSLLPLPLHRPLLSPLPALHPTDPSSHLNSPSSPRASPTPNASSTSPLLPAPPSAPSVFLAVNTSRRSGRRR